MVDIYEVLSDRLGRPIEIHIAPFKRTLHYLKAGQYDMAMPFIYSKQRAEYSHFLSAPLFSFRSIIYGTKGDFVKYTQISDLYGKKLGLRRGYHLSDEFSQAIADGKIETLLANTDKQLIGMLAKGRVNMIATPDYVIPVNQEMLSEQFVLYGYLSDVKVLRAAISLDSDLEQSFDQVDKVLSEMSRDGTLADIAKRHKALNVVCKKGVTC